MIRFVQRQRQAENLNPYLTRSCSHVIINNCSHFPMQYDTAFAYETSVEAIDPSDTT